MPKQYYTIRDFSGGMNTKQDPRDLRENECAFIENMSIDALGKIKTAGTMLAHSESPSDGTTNLTSYISNRGGSGDNIAVLDGGGGYNMFYFESDMSATSDNSVTHTIGTSVGNIQFVEPSTTPAGDSSSGGGGAGGELMIQD